MAVLINIVSLDFLQSRFVGIIFSISVASSISLANSWLVYKAELKIPPRNLKLAC